jgi:4-amino-4-deoxy-L-arabinose transferase-like glycosyltransferase
VTPAAAEPAGARGGNAAVALLAAAVIVRLWVMPLWSSLWLDEFGTTWITSTPLSEIVEKARLFPQSIPYAALVRLTRTVTGSSEASLRWPSLLAMLGAAGIVVCLGRRLFGRAAGVAAGAIFVTIPQVEFSAGDARPYAPGVLAAAAALLLLVRWLDDGRTADGVGYVLCAALSVYLHEFFAPALVVHVLYAWRRRRTSAVSAQAMAAAALALGLLLVPAGALAVEIGSQWRTHVFGSPAGVLRLLQALLPVRVLGLLVPALVVAAIFRAVRGMATEPLDSRDRDALALLGAGVLVPPFALFAVSRWTGASLLEGRYLLSSAPAWAVLLGALVARLRPVRAPNVVLALTLAMALAVRGELTRWPIAHGREDWRSAVAAVNAVNGDRPVFLSGSFVESSDPALVRDPRHEEYFLAPLAYYPTRGRSVVLPLRAQAAGDVEGERRIARAMTADGFALIERSSRFPSWSSWLATRVVPIGYTAREVWTSPALRASVYVRTP